MGRPRHNARVKSQLPCRGFVSQPSDSLSRVEDLPGDLLAEQRFYYRVRAPEYDQWWQRTGRYDSGDAALRYWETQVETVAAALEEFGPAGDVLELAGGTGWWSARLAETAGHLTVVDASPETLEINRERLGAGQDVTYVVADLFEWQPERTYDVVFFSFWISHVPHANFSSFWRMVGRCLRPGGRVFLVDTRRASGDGSFLNVDPHVLGESDEIQHRTLNDSSEHRLIKIYYAPEQLSELLAHEDWQADFQGTEWFLYGKARPGAGGKGTG